jgi:DNA modification methylase
MLTITNEDCMDLMVSNTMEIENRVFTGNSLGILKTFPGKSADCCVTRPPYYRLRDYGVPGQIGLEDTPDEYIAKLAAVFREIRRVLKDEGTLWVVIGDSYNGSGKNAGNTRPLKAKQMTNGKSRETMPSILKGFPAKSLYGIPFRLALALMNEGWILRQDIVWHKAAPMPESVKDRFFRSHEYLFFFVKKPRYYFNHRHALEKAASFNGQKNASEPLGKSEAARPKRGYAVKPDATGLLPQRHGSSIETAEIRVMRDVWRVTPEPSKIAHYAMFPQKLITPCILCGCPENEIVLDPFMGSGTTAVVAKKLGRKYIGCEINPEYARIAERRIAEINPLFEGAP